jgi:hypothetical protein
VIFEAFVISIPEKVISEQGLSIEQFTLTIGLPRAEAVLNNTC